jgi:hypothetical protein
LRPRIAALDKDIDWARVRELAHQPRGVPVPVTGGKPGLDAVVADSRLVENMVPAGSNWDGKSGLLIDEKSFRELLGDRDTPPPVSSAQ